ncbi:MAG TPA: hypothetical protein VMF69_19275, partial [Gemmataceae bacterium]|nr:hypothetical protein [Gemmataceae bacterium]
MYNRTPWSAFALMAALAAVRMAVAAPPSNDGATIGGGSNILPKPSTERTLRLPNPPFNYVDVELPAHFKTPAARRFDNTPSYNALSDNGATLGRVLFYDTRLSVNNTIAC